MGVGVAALLSDSPRIDTEGVNADIVSIASSRTSSAMLSPSGVVSKKDWDPNAKVCQVCNKKFTLRIRRHHCRACGKCVCDECSPKTVVSSFGPEFRGRAVRVCLPCIEKDRMEKQKLAQEADQFQRMLEQSEAENANLRQVVESEKNTREEVERAAASREAHLEAEIANAEQSVESLKKQLADAEWKLGEKEDSKRSRGAPQSKGF